MVLTLGERMRDVALELAAQFDRRNNSSAQGDWIRARLDAPRVTDQLELGPEPPEELPARRLKRLAPIPPETADQTLLDRAEWHHRRAERDLAAQHLAAVRAPAPRGRYLRALLELDAGLEAGPALEQAAQVLQEAGDRVRYDCCRCWLAISSSEPTMLDQAIEQLRGCADQATVSYFEVQRAILARSYARKEGWERLSATMGDAADTEDGLLLGECLLTAAAWRRQDFPQEQNKYAYQAKEVFTLVDAPARVVDALEAIRLSHVQARTMGEFRKFVADELSPKRGLLRKRDGVDAPPEVLRFLRYQRGAGLIDTGRAAEAVADLRYAMEGARARDADAPQRAYYLAFAYHAAGMYREAAEELGHYMSWLDRIAELYPDSDKDMAERAHALLAECEAKAGLSRP
ncbi:MAG: hypothetical protein J2O48_03995 [Solirubrobacterales bacterium]|nr:hypothetical protein [Solirubrobacterales bacterium]